jgi:hypothetical protein
MPSNIVDFVSAAYRSGVECSIAEIRVLPEYEGLSALEVLAALENVCKQAKIDCFPPIETGELDDVRVFSARKLSNEFYTSLDQSLRAGEGHKVEFKQTLGLNTRRLQNDQGARHEDLFQDEIIHEVIKTITAFLNADGGTLAIGICDNGSPYGIENEFPYIGGSKNLDQWELRLTAALSSFIPDYRLILGYLQYGIVDRNGCKICVVIVEPRRDRICVCRKANKDGSDEIVSGRETSHLNCKHAR